MKERKWLAYWYSEAEDRKKTLHRVQYQQIKCRVIFDVKPGENFRRKARLVAGGNTTATPAALPYSSVVSRESVRTALTIAVLNSLKV